MRHKEAFVKSAMNKILVILARVLRMMIVRTAQALLSKKTVSAWLVVKDYLDVRSVDFQ